MYMQAYVGIFNNVIEQYSWNVYVHLRVSSDKDMRYVNLRDEIM